MCLGAFELIVDRLIEEKKISFIYMYIGVFRWKGFLNSWGWGYGV